MRDIRFELQNLANKLRVMWGNNPDSALIEEVVAILGSDPEPSQEPEPVKTTRSNKGASK